MKILNEGHREKAVCPACHDIRDVVYRYRPYITEDGDTIPEVLQGFCEGCGERLLIPPQSIPKIKPYYQRLSKTQEYKVPSVIDDILLNIGASIKMEKPETFKSVLRFYLERTSRWNRIDARSSHKLGPASTRLSFRVDEPTDALLQHTTRKLAINKSRFVTLMFWDAKDRLLKNTPEAEAFRTGTKFLHAPDAATIGKINAGRC